jgi:hypothetical protein
VNPGGGVQLSIHDFLIQFFAGLMFRSEISHEIIFHVTGTSDLT